MEIMAGLLRATPTNEAPVIAWPAICGTGVAARTRALRFSGGVLFVETPDKTWQAQLLQLESGYLRGFATLLGKDRVKKIEFVPAR